MAKFSKKLVSKCIYIQILKCTETELLGQFMQTGGWSLVHMWLVDGIGSKNWPLIQELLELLLCCPVDVERLKINSTPRLVKSLSTDSAHESVRLLATKLVEQWLYIVKAPKQLSSSMTGLSQSETLTTANATGLAAITDGKTPSVVDQQSGGMGGLAQEGVKNGLVGTESHQHSNGYLDDTEQPVVNGVDTEEEHNHHLDREDDVDAAKKSFRAIVEHQDQSSQKKTPLVLKITTKNGKQVVAKVVSPSSKKTKQDLIDPIEEGDDDEDEEEVVVNIESSKRPDEAAISEQAEKDSKKQDVDGAKEESKDSKAHSTSPNGSHGSSSKLAKLPRKGSKDAGGNDSGSETSGSNTTVSGSKSSSSASGGSSSTSIPSKKASISIEVRNPENRPKTVKTYNSQFRSHGLIEEAPPPPSRKGLKKPSSTSSSSTGISATSSSNSTSASVGSTASGTATKRSSSSPTPSSGKEGAPPPEKKPKEDPPERPGSIKLIPPKRQHALVESDMFMDALSATLRKDVKKRKRRTSGSESSAPSSGKPAEGGKPDGAAATSKAAPESPTGMSPALPETEATTPTTPTSPKPAVVPPIAPMSFYRDTLAEEDENKDGEEAKDADSEDAKKAPVDGDGEKNGDAMPAKEDAAAEDEDETIVKKPKRVRCELNDEDDGDDDEVAEDGEKKKKRRESQDGEKPEDTDDKTELMEVVMNDVEKKMAEEAGGGVEGSPRKADDEKEEEEATGKKPPGPGCGPDGPPGVLVIHRRKGPKKQLRWRVADELEEIRYFELDVTERCNVTKSFTDMKQMERVDERQKFLLARKVGSEDIMVERTPWRPLLLVDNVPTAPDGSQSVERKVQFARERGCLQALYFNKHMIPDSPVEPDPVDMYQTADPVHIPLEDVTGNPDSVNDFTSMPWPDPKSTPPHESAAFNSPFFPSDLPPGAGFGPGGFPPPFPAGAVAAALPGPAPWTIHPRPGALQPGMFPLNQPPPGMAAGGGGGGGGGGGSPNMMSLPPNIPPPGMFPGATNFNAPPPDLAIMGDGRRPPGASGDRDYRVGPPPPQQWVSNNNGRAFSANNPRGGGAPGYGNRGGGPGNWNRSAGSTGDRGRNGEEGRGNYRGHWMQNNTNRGHNNSRGGGGRKW
ncbi:pnuts protein [Anopheles sinensis]|uniref:Pnuts protein n=1 Tax=Anopheles sinensis TaxID=74873 RepID=A0A084WC62_ANOSI|nr:pnuts protein [Anopheles sinensis]